jgi:hypothetical protein
VINEGDQEHVSEAQSSRSTRPFTVFNELILIAALASAFVVSRSFLNNEIDREIRILLNRSWTLIVFEVLPILFFGLVPRYVTLGMAALLAVGLHQRHPNRRRLSRQPGLVACAAATAAALAGGLIALSQNLFRERPIPEFDAHDWPIMEARIGPAVMAAWAVLLVSGRWRSQPQWIDRTGRVFGAFWILLWLSRWYLIFTRPE